MPSTLLLAMALLAMEPARMPSMAVAKVSVVAVESLEELTTQYDAAYKQWREDIRSADRTARAALRETPPAKEYWGRFEALSQQDGRAKLWLMGHLKEAGVPLAERGGREMGYLKDLVANNREDEWFGDVLIKINRKAGKDASALAMLETVANETKSATNKAGGMFYLAGHLMKADDEASQARGLAMMEKVEAMADTPWAAQAKRSLVAGRLKAGFEAPDFSTKTLDGHEFKLSDYRGKVVLVDFYGFW